MPRIIAQRYLAQAMARAKARDKARAQSQLEGPSLADVDELCAEFGFHLGNDTYDGVSLETLRDVITAAITRWPLTTEPVADPLQSEALLEIRPADAPVTQETVLLDKGSGLMAFGMGHLGAFPAPQQSAAPPAIDISDKTVAGIRAVVLGLARSASPDTPPAAQPVNLAEPRNPDFSGGLTPSQHLDVVHGGADPTWRPIETAPRDGTEIIVLSGKRVSAVISNGPDSACFFNEFGDEESLVWFPTHWQPLPQPPNTPNPHD